MLLYCIAGGMDCVVACMTFTTHSNTFLPNPFKVHQYPWKQLLSVTELLSIVALNNAMLWL